MNRSREDFRWLTKKLKGEFPTSRIIEIEKGELSKRVIEKFFKITLGQPGIYLSQSIKFFLTAPDAKFAKRREKDSSWLNNFAKKLGMDNNEELKNIDLEEEKDLIVIFF